MYLSDTDFIFIFLSLFVIFYTRIGFPRKIYKKLVYYGFIISFFGWELFWSIGFSKNSLDYKTRAKILHYKQITSSNIIHGVCNSLTDTAVNILLFYFINKIFPGFNHFNCLFIISVVLIGITQNILATYLNLVPLTNDLSSAPLTLNPNCQESIKVCWNNQQEWVYYVVINYALILFYN